MKEIACFISPHGFGHATRAIAILEALQGISPEMHSHIFTTVPEGIFQETLVNYRYHPVKTDIGLVQSSALECDIPATIKQLDEFFPVRETLLETLASLCEPCSLVLCDIAPLGILVAQHLGIPSVLVENFTWDWIYESYIDGFPELMVHVQTMKELFLQADHHIQTEPLCHLAPGKPLCPPIYRRTKEDAPQIRRKLGAGDEKIVLLTMGGVDQELPDLGKLGEFTDLLFVFSGQKETTRIGENILLLERNCDLYHPDLVGVAEIVVCKAGYSTIAECCQAGARVMSVGREDFPESPPLQAYLENHLGGISISPVEYENGDWLLHIPALLARSKPVPATENGADRVAAFLHDLLF